MLRVRPGRGLRFFRDGALLLALATGCAPAPPGGGPQNAGNRTAGSQTAAPQDSLPEVAPDPREQLLTEMTAVLLSEKHLLRRPIDDALSREAFPKFLEQLDGAKLLFLQDHVTALSRYAERMDDELRNGDLVLARKGAALVTRRRAEVAKLVADLLSKPFDFTAADETETDPKKLTWAKTEAELVTRWQSALKLQVLERVQEMEDLLAGKDKSAKKPDGTPKPPDPAAEKALASIPTTPEAREEKARKDLATRYEARFVRLAKPEALEPAEQFFNSVNAVYDPHTQYLAPSAKDDFDIAITGTLEGIGAVLGEKDHVVVVQELVPGGASWQQGKLEAGNLILAVAQQGRDPVDVTDMPLQKVVSMIRGPKGTVVALTVKKADGRVETISITRDVVKIEATYARAAVLDLGPKNEPAGYIYLPGFYGDIGRGKNPRGERNATDDVRALLAIFQKKKLGSVVIDLRGNGGGLLSHARDISGLFVDRGPIVQTRDSEGKREVLADTDPTVSFSGDVVVLVDRFSASAAEILAAALQDYERAVIVGTGPTHGKGTVQAVVELDRLAKAPNGDPLGIFKLTMQQYFRINGESTQVRGVVPDVVLPDPASFVESGERTLFHPIPWASVDPLPHARQPHTWTKPDLVAASRTRLKSHPLFGKVESYSKLVKERRDTTKEPVERNAWLAKRKKDKDAIDAADPKLKDIKPLFDVQIVSASPAPAPPPSTSPDKKTPNKLDAWKDELARDPWVEESLHVLADMSKKRP